MLYFNAPNDDSFDIKTYKKRTSETVGTNSIRSAPDTADAAPSSMLGVQRCEMSSSSTLEGAGIYEQASDQENENRVRDSEQ